MPLDAILPAVVYEEFSAAVERAQEAADEIPAHPDDVEGEELESASDEATAGNLDAGGEDDETTTYNAVDASNRASEEGASSPQGEANGEGGVISVPETPTPAPLEFVGSEDALEEVPHRIKRRWRQHKFRKSSSAIRSCLCKW